MDGNFDVLAVMNAASRILAARVLSVVSLLMVFGLSVAATCLQTWPSMFVAAGFAILVFLPVLLRDARSKE